ncbi:MAG: acyltransferase family protein [Verrucomicrobiota bacterium]|nr:acyltransferase family protein [Verrucomicrobiota bacterium]
MRQIDRLHYMDSLRAAAMFLGLVLHGSVVFAQWNVDFCRVHEEPSAFVRLFPELIHVFRMQLFFLVAGFFSMMICQKRGIRSYAENRFKRIVIPFILCVLFLQPSVAGIYFLDISQKENTIVSQYFNFLLNPSYIIREPALTGNWFWHFWFMHLLIYFIGAFLIGNILTKKLGLQFRFIPNLLELISGKFGMLILALITYPTLLISAPFSEVATIGTSLDVLCYYGLFFIFGALFFTDITVFERFQKNIKYHIAPFIICLFLVLPMYDDMRLKAPPELLLQNLALYTGVESLSDLIGSFPFLQNPYNFSGIGAPLEWHLICILRTYTTWCAIILFIVLFKKFCSKESALGKYAADSSYFIYLIHLPIQWAICFYFRDRLDSSIAGYWICVFSTTIICVLLYHLTCRATPIGILLSGRKYSLSFTEEWNDLKKLIKSKALCLGVAILTLASFAAHLIESQNEKKLLYFSCHAKPEKIKLYVKGKTPKDLMAIHHIGGRNALHMATYGLPEPRPDEKITESIQLLLDAGFDPMSRDNFGQTPLHYAVRNGNKIALNLLLNAGADPNAVESEYGNTPLHLAATLKADDMIRKLVTAGGNPNKTRKNGDNSIEVYKKFHSQSLPVN